MSSQSFQKFGFLHNSHISNQISRVCQQDLLILMFSPSMFQSECCLHIFITKQAKSWALMLTWAQGGSPRGETHVVSLTSDVVTETRGHWAQGPGLILAIWTVLDTITNLKERIIWENCTMKRVRIGFRKSDLILLLLFSSVSVLADSLVEMLMREMPSECCSPGKSSSYLWTMSVKRTMQSLGRG